MFICGLHPHVGRYVVKRRDLVRPGPASEELAGLNPGVLRIPPRRLFHRAPPVTLAKQRRKPEWDRQMRNSNDDYTHARVCATKPRGLGRYRGESVIARSRESSTALVPARGSGTLGTGSEAAMINKPHTYLVLDD